jgi:hypothetical protein
MKKILLILTFLFPIHLYAQDIIIDERITDIYYANGIMTTERDAYISLDLIRNATLQDIYNNNLSERKRETNFDLLYNETYNMFWDKLETFKQKKMDDRWFWVTVDTAYSNTTV